MKRASTVVLIVLGVLFSGWLLMRWSPATAQAALEKDAAGPKKERGKIHTAGSASVRIAPNRARLFFGVQTMAPTLKEARTKNKSDVDSVIAAIQGLNIPGLRMKSTNVYVHPVHSKDKEETTLPQVLGYKAVNTFTVLVSSEEPEKLAAAATTVLDTALEKGVNSFEQITFFRDDLTSVRQQALAKATEDAVANATALATGAKRTLIEIVNIEGNNDPAYRQISISNSRSFAADETTSTELVAGEVEVTCRVGIIATYDAVE